MRKILYIVIFILTIFTVYVFSNFYSHRFSSNNNYSLFDGVLLSSDRDTCFSPNEKLVDANNNDWTHVFENAKDAVVKVTVSNSYSKTPSEYTSLVVVMISPLICSGLA